MADVAIIMTTWAPKGDAGRQRCDAARRALRSWHNRLRGATFTVYICDDGSDYVTRRGLGSLHHVAIADVCSEVGWEWTIIESPRLGVGGAMNAGLRQAFADGHNIVLYTADDWELIEPLNLAPSIWLLRWGAEGQASPAMVRLGPTHPNLSARTRQIPFDPGWALAYDWREGGYVYGDRPSLRHKVLYEAVGYYDEGLSATETERLFNERCAAWEAKSDQGGHRSLIWHAPNVTLAGPWHHIDTVELGEDDPATLTARYA